MDYACSKTLKLSLIVKFLLTCVYFLFVRLVLSGTLEMPFLAKCEGIH